MIKNSTSNQVSSVTTQEVRDFWQNNPLCANGIPHKLGSREFFDVYNAQREAIESVEFSSALHEYGNFSGKKVLDVGCGNGYVLAKYAEKNAEVFGIDITQAGVSLCEKRFEYLGLKGTFRVGDAQNIPFPDCTFDCVSSMGVLHHVPDIPAAVASIFRVLKPGGRLIVMFYHRHSAKYQLKYRVRSLLTGMSMQQLVNEFDGVGNPKGTVFSKAELKHLLSSFAELEMRVGFLETRDIILRGARYFPANMFKPLAGIMGWNLYAKARKPE